MHFDFHEIFSEKITFFKILLLKKVIKKRSSTSALGKQILFSSLKKLRILDLKKM